MEQPLPPLWAKQPPKQPHLLDVALDPSKHMLRPKTMLSWLAQNREGNLANSQIDYRRLSASLLTLISKLQRRNDLYDRFPHSVKLQISTISYKTSHLDQISLQKNCCSWLRWYIMDKNMRRKIGGEKELGERLKPQQGCQIHSETA